MSWDIARFDWHSLRSAGGAAGVPRAIAALERASSVEDALKSYWQIDNTVVVQGAVYEAALAAIPCLLNCLLRCTEVARPQILELLVQIGSGEAADVEIEARNENIINLCLAEIVRGFPIYIGILEYSRSLDERALCIDLLGLSGRADPLLRDRIRWYYQAVKKDHLPDGLIKLIASWEEEICD